MNILIIEDDFPIAHVLRQGLERAGYEVEVARDGRSGLVRALETLPDLVLLDVMLPGIDGWEVLRRLREARAPVSVLMLTARDTPDERAAGLEEGADDYLVKPFHFPELLARVRNLLRRGQAAQNPVLRLADLEMDLAKRRVSRGGQEVPLTRREYSLLEVLAVHEGRALSRGAIQAWLTGEETGAEALAEELRSLRAKIDRPGCTPLIFVLEDTYMLRSPERAGLVAA